MAFYEQFLSNFTDDEKKTDVVQYWAQVGMLAEKTILEDLNVFIHKYTDLSTFGVDTYRSWLAFFLKAVPNVTSCIAQATVKIEKATGSVAIPSGSLLVSNSGIIYQQQKDLLLHEGDSATFTVIQGQEKVVTGTYNEIIVLNASGVDLGYIKVYLGNREVPAVGYLEGYAIPTNGYYVYFQDEVLYVKIFKGPDVADPEGQSYTISYRTSLGYQGQITTNQLKSYQTTLIDSNGMSVSYTISNQTSSQGANPPTKNDLAALLRSRFYASINVSSVPEYTAWFRAQPEVGDCLVLSDYENWLRTGGPLVSTGFIDVFLMDKQGERLNDADYRILEQRLSLVKDVGVIRPNGFVRIPSYLKVQYKYTSNDIEFTQAAHNVINKFYAIDYVHSVGLSLFEDLDLSMVISELSKLNNAFGISIQAYHILEEPIVGFMSNLTITSYEDEAPSGGFYEYWDEGNPDEAIEPKILQRFVEVSNPAGLTTDIYLANEDLEPIGNAIGTRSNAVGIANVLISYNFETPGHVKCFWPTKDSGVLSVGAYNGCRVLGRVTILPYKSNLEE